MRCSLDTQAGYSVLWFRRLRERNEIGSRRFRVSKLLVLSLPFRRDLFSLLLLSPLLLPSTPLFLGSIPRPRRPKQMDLPLVSLRATLLAADDCPFEIVEHHSLPRIKRAP